MQTINYKSDFDFTFTVGEAFPDYDFRGVLTVGNSAVKSVVFSRKGDVFTNCFADGNAIHVVCKDHGLPPGVVMLELFAYLPDAIYSGGLRRVVAKTPTGIELTRSGAMWDGSALSADLCLPYALVTAYDIARAAGYVGTQEEFYRALAEAPTALQTLNNVNSLTVDWQQGKQAIADALSLQGQPSTAEEPFADLARKVLAIPRRAEGEDNAVTPKIIDPSLFDLFSEIHNHQRPEYPYMCGLSFGDMEINLAGAQAYYCSDGYFSQEGGLHRFADCTAGERYVIYYFDTEHFTLPPISVTIPLRYVIYNGIPSFTPFGSCHLSSFECYANETAPWAGGSELFTEIGSLNNIIIRGLKSTSARVARYNTGVGSANLSFPDLEIVTNNTVVQFNSTNQMYGNVYLPKLREANVTVVQNLKSSAIYFPALETFRVNVGPLVGVLSDIDIYLPSLTTCAVNSGGLTQRAGKEVRVHLGHQQTDNTLRISVGERNDTITEITIEPGFRGGLQINGAELTPDCLHSLILNLADNTDHATLTINMGATNLAKLSDSDRQIATDKNYTLC